MYDSRDYTKFQIQAVNSPRANEFMINCYHCDSAIVFEQDEKYIMVAGAYQRPIYLHIDCYEGFLSGLVLFYNEILVPTLPRQ